VLAQALLHLARQELADSARDEPAADGGSDKPDS
jgi:hypothetical protein